MIAARVMRGTKKHELKHPRCKQNNQSKQSKHAKQAKQASVSSKQL
jgi:hypothetical protein